MNRREETVLSTTNIFQSKLNQTIEVIREELDDHRAAINENTTELLSNHEFLGELNEKFEKISERLDELTLLVKGKKEEKVFEICPLTKREKDAFLGLYTLCQQYKFVTYKQLARKLSITVELATSYVTQLVGKGIPVLKKYQKSIAYLGLNKEFAQKQAKDNIVKLNHPLSYWIR